MLACRTICEFGPLVAGLTLHQHSRWDRQRTNGRLGAFWSPKACCDAKDFYRQSMDNPAAVLEWHKRGGGYFHEGICATQLDGRGWGLIVKDDAGVISSGTVLVKTPPKLLWIAHESKVPEVEEPLAPGESLPKASAALRRRLLAALDSPDPFVESMHPPNTMPLRLVAGTVASDAPESAKQLLKGTSLLNHTLSLRSKLLKAVKPQLELAEDKEKCWQACVWAQAVIMSRAFHVPKGSDRLVLIPIVDIANHAPTYKLANAEFRDNSDGSISMLASRDIAPKEEVCICYGEHTNEQLLFCYGFVIPQNPCEGLLCPLQFPDTPSKAELLHYSLADHRSRHGRNPAAKAGPTLRCPSKMEPASAELILALKIFGMPEDARGHVGAMCYGLTGFTLFSLLNCWQTLFNKFFSGPEFGCKIPLTLGRTWWIISGRHTRFDQDFIPTGSVQPLRFKQQGVWSCMMQRAIVVLLSVWNRHTYIKLYSIVDSILGFTWIYLVHLLSPQACRHSSGSLSVLRNHWCIHVSFLVKPCKRGTPVYASSRNSSTSSRLPSKLHARKGPKTF